MIPKSDVKSIGSYSAIFENYHKTLEGLRIYETLKKSQSGEEKMKINH